MMTECPACFKDTMGLDGRCARCDVQMPSSRPLIDTVGRANPRRREDQDRTGAFTDYVRTKEDKS